MQAIDIETRFDAIQHQFEKIDARFDKLDSFLAKMFRRFERRFDAIDATMTTKADLEPLKNATDGLYGRVDTLETEYAAISSQLTRIAGILEGHN